MKEGRKTKYPEKTPGDELQNKVGFYLWFGSVYSRFSEIGGRVGRWVGGGGGGD